MESLDQVESVLCRVLSCGLPGSGLTATVKSDDIISLCLQTSQKLENFEYRSFINKLSKGEVAQELVRVVRETFKSQEVMLEIEPPVKICGDTHGQYSDVLRIFDRIGFPPSTNYLFLGDYVDRGHHSLEVIILFFSYKVLYPGNFLLIRGNHECRQINRVYGFYEECQRRYNAEVYQIFQDVFEWMPLTALVGGKILCMHGGISEQLKSLDDLKSISRPCEPSVPSLAIDLLWADPDKNANKFLPNTRGVSVCFGPEQVHQAIKRLGIDMIVRAHQVVQDGYEFFANKKLVTIFSAPHYCGQFDNASAVLVVDSDLVCWIHIVKCTTKMGKLKLR